MIGKIFVILISIFIFMSCGREAVTEAPCLDAGDSTKLHPSGFVLVECGCGNTYKEGIWENEMCDSGYEESFLCQKLCSEAGIEWGMRCY